MIMKNTVRLFLPLLLAVCLDAHSGTPSGSQASVASAPAASKDAAASKAASKDPAVSIRNFAFSPVSMTVAAGTTVRWKNLDGEPHTVRAVDGSFKSDALDQDDSFTYKFDQPGTYRYVCSIHPQMIGTIVVTASKSK